MDLVARRDWTGLVDAGGSIYVLLKIAATVGQNLLQIGAQMRGETLDAFMASARASRARRSRGRAEHGTHRRRHRLLARALHRALL